MADSELRREWGTVFAASIGVMASCITLVNYSLGVFVVPLSDEFGWSRRDIALATSYVTTGALLTSFVVRVACRSNQRRMADCSVPGVLWYCVLRAWRVHGWLGRILRHLSVNGACCSRNSADNIYKDSCFADCAASRPCDWPHSSRNWAGGIHCTSRCGLFRQYIWLARRLRRSGGLSAVSRDALVSHISA